MKKIFVVFVVFSLFILSLCDDIPGCKTLASGGTTCTTCEDGYLKVAAGAGCLYGCETEGSDAAAGKCAECKTGYKIQTNALGCIHGCKTEAENACTVCNDGYKLTEAKTCIKGCETADTTASSAKCSKCTTEANLSTDGLSCIANCKTTGHNSEVCSECASGYTLSTDKTSCTAEAKKDDDKSSSFGLYTSLLMFALGLLF